MKYLKTFENINTSNKLDDIKIQLEYAYIQYFKNEDEYQDFCKDVNGVDDIDDVDWDSIPQDILDNLSKIYDIYDSYDEFSEKDNDTLIGIIIEIMEEIDLDDCDHLRNLSYNDFKIAKMSQKYNL